MVLTFHDLLSLSYSADSLFQVDEVYDVEFNQPVPEQIESTLDLISRNEPNSYCEVKLTCKRVSLEESEH